MDFGVGEFESLRGYKKKKKYADLLTYINYNTCLCNIKLKQYDRYIWR